MNKPRGRTYQRFPCELTPRQIAETKRIADEARIAYVELVRRALDFAYANPLFLASISSPTSFQELGQ